MRTEEEKLKRKEKYKLIKDEVNRKRRIYNSNPKVRQRIKEEDKRWKENHKEVSMVRNRIYKKRYGNNLKKEVFENYGLKCSCCGESNLKLLTVDHIDGNGTKHRKEIKNKMYNWLRNNNFPNGFQTLCFNCNWGKHINGGICPHKA